MSVNILFERWYDLKKCSICKDVKPIKSFGLRNRKDSNGNVYKTYNSVCKVCNSERAKQRYYDMKEKGIRFVYRLIDENNEIVYVGKTESLPTRTNQHFSKNSHLYPKVKGSKLRLQYIAMASTSLMQIREIYYINLYKPRYNTIFMNDEPSIFISDFANDVWLDYVPSKEIAIQNKLGYFNEFKKIKTIFKRKRNNKYYVYIEVEEGKGKTKQISKGSFDNEEEANKLLKLLKEQNIKHLGHI